jgi:hypothetical protein
VSGLAEQDVRGWPPAHDLAELQRLEHLTAHRQA